MRRSRILTSFVALVTAVTTVVACGTSRTPPAPRQSPLFYAKGGSLYVSDPVGTPGRKLTEGPADSQPAPSPDGTRIAYVRKGNRADRGGELWVLDVKSGNSKRLVDPASVVRKFGDAPPKFDTPRWSPSGEKIAFLTTTFGGGGFLLTAAIEGGAVAMPKKPMLADESYAWSPDGRKIAWAGGRSDVSPVDVNVLAVGGISTPVATGTNATSVSFDAEGRTVVFANLDATGSASRATPFVLRRGGIYVVDPPSEPRALVAGTETYGDVQVLSSGDVAFTETNPGQKTKTIQTMAVDQTRQKIADTRLDAPSPAWTWDSTVAYIGTEADKPLLVTQEGKTARVDTGVESFAWPPGA